MRPRRPLALAALAAAALAPAALAAPAGAAERIAFTAVAGDQTDLFAIAPDGSARTRLTDGRARGASSYSADWRDDGSAIAFASDRDRRRPSYGDPSEIYVMAPDGAEQRRLTHNGADDDLPDWSPDGTRIAFTRVEETDDGIAAAIWTMAAGGGDERQLTSGPGLAFGPRWSPDGTSIAYTQLTLDGRAPGVEVRVVPAAGGESRVLATDGGTPAWSPDGQRIAYVSLRDRHGESCLSDECFPATELYVMRADGSEQLRLTTTEQSEADPAWSADGRRIAFASDRFYPPGQSYELWAMRMDGACPVRLTAGAAHAYQPAWSPAEVAGLPPLLPGGDAGDCEQPELAYAGPELDAARRWRGVPLLWLGQSHEGRALSQVGAAGPRSFGFAYGDCLERSGRCGDPIAVESHTICARNPIAYGSLGLADERLRLRGALVAHYDGGPFYDVYTGATTVTVMGLEGRRGPSRLRRLVAELRRFENGAPGRLAPPAFAPSTRRELRRVELLVRRHGRGGARMRLRITRRELRDRLALARTLRLLPRPSGADRRRAARCDRRPRRGSFASERSAARPAGAAKALHRLAR